MEKKKNKGVIVLIILLILCIIGLVLYILVDKDIIKLNNTTIENEQVESNTNEDKEDEKGIEISVDNENIKTLFNNAHHLSTGPESQIYRNGGYKVSEMTNDEKFTLLARQWFSLITQIGPSSADDFNWTLYLDENVLKNIYEKTFGPNTYSQVNQISDGSCTTLTYDTANKRYSYVGQYGCGGTSTFAVKEKIISATKYSDRIEIVSAAFYLDASTLQIYKDYNKTKSLGENVFYSNNYTDEEREALEDKYIEENKDNLEQYTYTYNLNEDGFYYLTSVERTKA